MLPASLLDDEPSTSSRSLRYLSKAFSFVHAWSCSSWSCTTIYNGSYFPKTELVEVISENSPIDSVYFLGLCFSWLFSGSLLTFELISFYEMMLVSYYALVLSTDKGPWASFLFFFFLFFLCFAFWFFYSSIFKSNYY